tara:strand:+ start:781 stop:1671 length:891 start_codon:yes stop_codon:yes gene_type:complete
MTDKQNFSGIIVPLVTPFDKDGNLDSEKINILIERYLNIGVHGFYIGGTTGEGLFQSVNERCQFLKVVSELVGNKGLLIAQVGALSERDVYKITIFASENHFDVISSTPPFYFNHSEREIINYYKRLSKISDLPILMYNTPGATGQSISIDAQIDMLKLPNIIGSKHTDMNFFNAERLLREIPTAAIFNGPDEMLTGGLAMGMVGGIGSTYNLMPRLYLEIYNSMNLGELKNAQRLQAIANDVTFELLRISPGVVPGIKHGLKVLGFDVGGPRKPFLPIESDNRIFEKLLIDANGF